MEIDIFLNEKHALLSSNLVPRTLKIAFLGLWNFKIFWGGTRFDPPPPHLEKGTNVPLLIQSVTPSKPLLQFLLKPLSTLYIHYKKSWRARMWPHLHVQIYSIASVLQTLMNAWIQRCLIVRVASVFVKTHRVATCVNVNRVCYILTTLAKVSSLFQIHEKTQGQRLKGLWPCYLVHRAS